MALVTADSEGSFPHALLQRAADLPAGRPIVVMIHGYRFSPRIPEASPHRHILSLAPDPAAQRAMSWPRALGFTENGDEGLAVAFGWHARGGLRAAYARAAGAGAELAALVDALVLAARRPVAMIGHSLGARVALAAMQRAAPGSVGRVVLLSAAELQGRAEAAIASPAGMLAEVVNVTSRENDPYDLGLELILSGGRQRALGFGLGQPRRNWVDLQIDDPDTLDSLRRLGFSIEGRASRACHWSPYLRAGLFAVWRTVLCQPAALPLPLLAMARPERPARRWSRLIAPGRADRAAAQRRLSSS